jgi:hypothetical protein
MAAGIKYNVVAANPWLGKYNLASDTIKFLLTNTAPVPGTDTTYASISANELANGNGYTTGGATATLTSASQTGGLFKYIATLPNPTWSFTGAATFRYVVAYDFTATNKDLLGAWDYGASITTVNGDTFQMLLDAVAGVIQCS